MCCTKIIRYQVDTVFKDLVATIPGAHLPPGAVTSRSIYTLLASRDGPSGRINIPARGSVVIRREYHTAHFGGADVTTVRVVSTYNLDTYTPKSLLDMSMWLVRQPPRSSWAIMCHDGERTREWTFLDPSALDVEVPTDEAAARRGIHGQLVPTPFTLSQRAELARARDRAAAEQALEVEEDWETDDDLLVERALQSLERDASLGGGAAAAESPAGAEDSPGTPSCVVCMENVIALMIKPCNHICICHGCNSALKQRLCPICRGPIMTTERAYLP